MRNPFGTGGFGQTPDPSAYNFNQGQGDAGADDGAADERVQRALEERDTPYEVSPNHNFRVVISYAAEGRSQLVIVESRTRASRGREWRRVWSDAFTVPGRLPWERALDLLTDGDAYALGGWAIAQQGGGTSAYFTASLPADASPAELEDAIMLVAEAADDKEKAVVGTDDN